MTEVEHLRRAADDFGTPLYVYDVDVIRAAVERVQRLMSQAAPVRIYYSAKANPTVAVAMLMRTLGIGLDACSEGDLHLARRAGFDSADITYTGFGTNQRELLAAAHVGSLVLDSIADIDLASQAGIARMIGIRVNPQISAGFHSHVAAGSSDAKFGVARTEIYEAASRARSAGLTVEGLHCHLGSELLDAGPHTRALDVLAEIAEEIPSVRWINIGGGFGTPRRIGDPAYPWEVLALHASTRLQLADGRRLELRIEPGSHCLMNAGVLIGRVLTVKRAADGGPQIIVTDANTNHLVSVLLYDATHPARILSPRTGSLSRSLIAGNLMQAGDVLAHDIDLPAVERNDLIAFSHAGAYASSRATSFNERPLAAEAMLEAGRIRLIRRHGSAEDLFARDLTD